MNVGRIDYSEEFSLYKEGITKHTVRLLHAIEIERLNLGRKLGFELSTAKESRIQRGYLERKDEDEPLNRLLILVLCFLKFQDRITLKTVI